MFRHLVKNLLPIIIFHSSREKGGKRACTALKTPPNGIGAKNWFAPHYFTPFSLVMKCCSVSRSITLTLCVVFSSLIRCVWACADELLFLKYWKSFFKWFWAKIHTMKCARANSEHSHFTCSHTSTHDWSWKRDNCVTFQQIFQRR